MSLSSQRYAKALFDLSVEKGLTGPIRKELEQFTDSVEANEDFRAMMRNPGIRSGHKKRVITALIGEEATIELLHFLHLLVDNERIAELPVIQKDFTSMVDAYSNILQMTIISAMPIPEDQVEALKKKYLHQFGGTDIKCEIEIDPDLIGGLKVIIGDRVFDGTLRSKMEGLRQYVMKSQRLTF